MDIIPLGRKIFCHRHLHRAPVTQRDNRLHNPFAKRFRPNQRPILIIFDCPGKNLRCAGAVAINKHRHRNVHTGLIRFIIRTAAILILRIDDQSFGQQLIQHFTDRLQYAARVITQIHNHRFHPLSLQAREGFLKLLHRRLGELRDLDKAHIPFQHLVLHGRHSNLPPLHISLHIVLLAFTRQAQMYLGAFLPFNHRHQLCQLLPVHFRIVNLDNHVPVLHPCFLRRRPRIHMQRRHSLCLRVLLQHHANPIINSCGALVKGRIFLCRKIIGIWIAQPAEHPHIDPFRHRIRVHPFIIILVNQICQLPHFLLDTVLGERLFGGSSRFLCRHTRSALPPDRQEQPAGSQRHYQRHYQSAGNSRRQPLAKSPAPPA